MTHPSTVKTGANAAGADGRPYPREWFEVTKWSREPEPITIQRETEKKLFTVTRSYNKRSDWRTFYPTLEEANAVIAERLAREADAERIKRIRDAASELLYAAMLLSELGEVLGENNAAVVIARAAIAKATGGAS